MGGWLGGRGMKGWGRGRRVVGEGWLGGWGTREWVDG